MSIIAPVPRAQGNPSNSKPRYGSGSILTSPYPNPENSNSTNGLGCEGRSSSPTKDSMAWDSPVESCNTRLAVGLYSWVVRGLTTVVSDKVLALRETSTIGNEPTRPNRRRAIRT